ncbi:MAG: zinc ribbon domain-containing protein, partial [Planctomycetes bacterium]|nr:zinc ribbon domain-containing protein [Planctomycetota bacterium]
MPDRQINPGHNAVRDTLRIIGPIILLTALGFLIVGLVDFFRAFGGFGPPKLFWCVFVGILLLPMGGALTSYGYMGKVMRYMAQETAPVGKDTFNYLAQGTQEGIKTVAGVIGQGLREGGLGGAAPTMVRCHKCNALAPAEARFCDNCGRAF